MYQSYFILQNSILDNYYKFTFSMFFELSGIQIEDESQQLNKLSLYIYIYIYVILILRKPLQRHLNIKRGREREREREDRITATTFIKKLLSEITLILLLYCKFYDGCCEVVRTTCCLWQLPSMTYVF